MSTTAADIPVLPALVDGVVAHRRRGAVAHAFQGKAYQWLVDLDHLPALPWYLRPFAGFRAADHLAADSEAGSRPAVIAAGSTDIKTNVLAYLAAQGIELGPAARIVMLANARVFGYVFDPLSVFWCFGTDGELRCLIAEVHNTYGGRHAYVLQLDSNGDTQTDKVFYVSPFNDVSGRYRMHFDMSAERVGVRITLVRDQQPRFDATFSGRVLPAGHASIAKMVLRRPAMPFRVSASIRFHGITLWLKGLRIVPRPGLPSGDPPPEKPAKPQNTATVAECPAGR